jgi:hypothetical protein
LNALAPNVETLWPEEVGEKPPPPPPRHNEPERMWEVLAGHDAYCDWWLLPDDDLKGRLKVPPKQQKPLAP